MGTHRSVDHLVVKSSGTKEKHGDQWRSRYLWPLVSAGGRPHRAGLTVQGTLECWFPLLHLRVTESYNLVGGPSMAGPVPPTSERLSGSAKFTHLEAS